MSRPIEVQLPSGQVILARVAMDGPSNVTDAKVLKNLDVDELRTVVHGVSDSMRAALDDLRPDEVASSSASN